MTTTTIILTIISVTVISAAAEITKNRLIGYFHRDIMHLVYPPPPPQKKRGGPFSLISLGMTVIPWRCLCNLVFLNFFSEGEVGGKHKVHYGFGENGERKV